MSPPNNSISCEDFFSPSLQEHIFPSNSLILLSIKRRGNIVDHSIRKSTKKSRTNLTGDNVSISSSLYRQTKLYSCLATNSEIPKRTDV